MGQKKSVCLVTIQETDQIEGFEYASAPISKRNKALEEKYKWKRDAAGIKKAGAFGCFYTACLPVC